MKMNNISSLELQNSSVGLFEKNLPKYIDLISWIRFYPDLFLDLIKPETGGITIHPDQRKFLRCAVRFFSLNGCFPRGWSKTWSEVASLVIIAIAFPNIELSLTAQTKDNSAELLKDKINELLKQYPMLTNELAKKPSFQKGDAEVIFKNGSKID